MTENTTTTIVLTDAAAAIVKTDVGAGKAANLRYGKYVTEMSVTIDTLPEHVAIFRDAYKAAYPKASGGEVKAYATKVRNGLKYQILKDVEDDDDSTEETVKNLLTQAGLKATLEEVTAAWTAAQK